MPLPTGMGRIWAVVPPFFGESTLPLPGALRRTESIAGESPGAFVRRAVTSARSAGGFRGTEADAFQPTKPAIDAVSGKQANFPAVTGYVLTLQRI